jgi:two-component system, NtrC family, sensor histidine kinase KinB
MTSLRNRLWLGFGSLLLILLVVSSLSMIVFTRYSHALERVFRENYDSAVYCDSMKESLDQLNTRAQRLIWEEPAARKIDPLEIETRFDSSLASQMGNCTLPGEREASQHLANLWWQYRDHYSKFNNVQTGRSDLYKQDLLPRYDELKEVAQHVADMNMSNMISVDGQAKSTLVAVRNSLLILVVAGTLLAGIVVWTAGVSILRPLRDFTQSARQIEAGNLDLNLKPRSKDEIGELAEAFNSMASRLRDFKRIVHDRLMRSEQTTQLAIDSLPDAVFVIGPDDRIEISNNSARSYFGIEPGREVSSLGLNWLQPLHQEVKTHNRPVEPRGYKSAIQLFVDGTERFLLPRAVPMLSPDQRQLGVTLILVDVTQLRQVDEAKSSLVSTVSHELRTPLTSQQLLLGLLLTSAGPKLSASQKRMLEVAKADSDRLYRTIEELLSLSRMESGRAQFQFRDVSPREIVLSAVEPLRQLFVDKNLRLSVTVSDDLPLVKADSTAVHSALTNLLSNALKFTPPGGEVIVSADAADTSVAFSVNDTGPGIPREFRPRIFEKFFRVPVPSGPSGAGLGLSITKSIIEAHHGKIEFICPETGGVVFRFHIPIPAAVTTAAFAGEFPNPPSPSFPHSSAPARSPG